MPIEDHQNSRQIYPPCGTAVREREIIHTQRHSQAAVAFSICTSRRLMFIGRMSGTREACGQQAQMTILCRLGQ